MSEDQASRHAAAGTERLRENTPPAPGVHAHAWMGGRPGSRLSKRQRVRVMLELLELDGPFCRWPGCPLRGVAATAPDVSGLMAQFEVNHVGGPVDHWLDWVELMHPDCNKKARFDPGQQARALALRSARPVRENAAGAGDGWAGLHERVDYQSGSPEMQVNDDAEPVWENWLWAMIRLLGRVTKYEAINVGAHAAGWSVQASRRAYEKRAWVPHKMLGDHPELPLEEFAGEVADPRDGEKHRVRMVRLRAGWDLEMAKDREGRDVGLRPRRGAP